VGLTVRSLLDSEINNSQCAWFSDSLVVSYTIFVLFAYNFRAYLVNVATKNSRGSYVVIVETYKDMHWP
jgi:hypothetical protein